MNLDLLKKLVKLANNNPNDNEANLAARRVCKMLDNYQFDNGSILYGQSKVNYTPPRTAADKVNVKPDPVKEQWPWTSYGFDSAYNFEDVIRKMKETIWREEQRREQEFKGGQYYSVMYNEYAPNPNTKRNLKCYRCGETKPTRFRGIPEAWVCMECRGKEYTEEKK